MPNNPQPQQRFLRRTWNDVKGNAKWALVSSVIGLKWGALVVAVMMLVDWLRSQPSGFFGMWGGFAVAGALAIATYNKGTWKIKITAMFLLLLTTPLLWLVSKLNFVNPRSIDKPTKPIAPVATPLLSPKAEPLHKEPDVAPQKKSRKTATAPTLPPAATNSPYNPQATPSQPSGNILNVAPGGVGSLNQSGGITARDVTITGAGVRLTMRMKSPPSIQENTGDYLAEWDISLNGQVPRFTIYVASPTLVDIHLIPTPGMFMTSLTEQDNPDGSKLLGLAPAFGTYTIAVRSKVREKIQFFYSCEGASCVCDGPTCQN